MILRKDWNRLKRGDVVVINGTPRTVLHGPAGSFAEKGMKPHDCCWTGITLARRANSWINRAYVIKGWYDCYKNSYILKTLDSSDKKYLHKHEAQRLSDLGFDWRRQLAREREEDIQYAIRCKNQYGNSSRSLCSQRRAEGRLNLA